MKNDPIRVQSSGTDQEGGVDGGGIGLLLFAAAAIWLLIFQSNVFN